MDSVIADDQADQRFQERPAARAPLHGLIGAWTVSLIKSVDGAIDRFYEGYRPGADEAVKRRARGWALLKALVCLIIGDDGVHGRPGGKPTWAPPALAAIRRLTCPPL